MVSNSGSLLVHVPQVSGLRTRERVRIVGRAVVRAAELLGADIEVFQKRHLLSVWVYYRNGERELSPIYIDWGKDWGEHEVFNSMRSELSRFALHHTNPVLQSPQVS